MLTKLFFCVFLSFFGQSLKANKIQLSIQIHTYPGITKIQILGPKNSAWSVNEKAPWALLVRGQRIWFSSSKTFLVPCFLLKYSWQIEGYFCSQEHGGLCIKKIF